MNPQGKVVVGKRRLESIGVKTPKEIREDKTNKNSLNLVQDVYASQLLFECGVANVYLPGFNVGAQLTLSLPDMKEFVKGKGKIGDYLYHLYTHNPLHKQRGVLDQTWRTWVIWDVINIAWLINPSWVPSSIIKSSTLNDELYWVRQNNSINLAI